MLPIKTIILKIPYEFLSLKYKNKLSFLLWVFKGIPLSTRDFNQFVRNCITNRHRAFTLKYEFRGISAAIYKGFTCAYVSFP